MWENTVKTVFFSFFFQSKRRADCCPYGSGVVYISLGDLRQNISVCCCIHWYACLWKTINVNCLTFKSLKMWNVESVVGAHALEDGSKSKHWHSHSALVKKMPRDLFTRVAHRLWHSYLCWLLMCSITPHLNFHLWCLELLFLLRTFSFSPM